MHTDRAFAAELDTLRRRLLRMAGRVEAMIADAVRSLVEDDVKLAKSVVQDDRLVNRDELEIDKHCFEILARWQPMAGDLRLILMCSRMGTDLERIADLAVNISDRARQLNKASYRGPYPQISEMDVHCRHMLHKAIQSFLDSDPKAARDVISEDDAIDKLYGQVSKSLLADMTAGRMDVECGLPLQNVAKYLERIGDHSTNLAEQVVWLVRGDDIRHIGRR